VEEVLHVECGVASQFVCGAVICAGWVVQCLRRVGIALFDWDANSQGQGAG